MPHQRPTTAAELILDLEARAGGSAEADFEVPAEEWALLVQFARAERAALDELADRAAPTVVS